MAQLPGKTLYNRPDPFAHVYAFFASSSHAEQIANSLNRQQYTGLGKWISGSFHVVYLPGRFPAVAGKLTGAR